MEEAKDYKKYLKGLKDATSRKGPKNIKMRKIMGLAGMKLGNIQGLLAGRSALKKRTGGAMLKNPGKADLDKDGKLSGYEKKRGMAIEKSMSGKPMKAVGGALALGVGGDKLRKKFGKKMPLGLGAAALLADKKKKILGRSKGGGADTGKKGEMKSKIGVTMNKLKRRIKGTVSRPEMKFIRKMVPGVATKMGGGMMKKYSVGGNVLHKLKSQKELKKITDSDAYKKADYKGKTEMLGGKVTTGKEMQKKAEGGPASRSAMAEQQRRMGQRKKKTGLLGRAGRGVGKATGRRAGIPSLPGKRKEDSSVTLGKFMKAKTKALNESVAAGGMKRERVTQGSRMRRKEDFIKDVAAGKYKKPSKDAAYYKSIGLTGERGDRAVKDFFKPESLKSRNQKVVLTYKSVGGSVTVKTKLGRNKPTKMY